MNKLWQRIFLEERFSIGLSFFRLAVALTTAAHVIPSFFHLDDNYFAATAFKTTNTIFFPTAFVNFISQSPDWLVVFFVWIFCLSCFSFFIGLFAQLGCIVMTLSCYYFYALNSFHIGTLSWDILLVTLFLMCLTPYHGDYFSVDCLRCDDENAYQRKRPFFLQRLLQLQLGFTYFYTALYKITAEGNWLTGNPIYYIMNYPHAGTTKLFLLRDFLRVHPDLCYWIGILIVIVEFGMLFLLFIPKTRAAAIYLGIVFHLILVLTLDVPAIFLFLFPPQLLLFIHPDHVVRWIEQKRQQHLSGKRRQLVYDGNCQFCVASVKKIKILDLFGTLECIDLHRVTDLGSYHPRLTKELAMSQLHLIEPYGEMWGGFAVFRRICLSMPMLYILIPVFYFPGMKLLGPWVYKIIAKNRYLFHFNKTCENNACFRSVVILGLILAFGFLTPKSSFAQVYLFGTNQKMSTDLENTVDDIFNLDKDERFRYRLIEENQDAAKIRENKFEHEQKAARLEEKIQSWASRFVQN